MPLTDWTTKRATWVNTLNTSILKTDLEQKKTDFTTLKNEITTFLQQNSTVSLDSGILKQVGQLQQDISLLQQTSNSLDVDVESAVARDQLLRSYPTDRTSHELMFLGRPVKKGLVPYLWALGILFIGIGIYLFYYQGHELGLFPTSSYGDQPLSSQLYLYLTAFLSNRIVLTSAVLACMILLTVLTMMKFMSG